MNPVKLDIHAHTEQRPNSSLLIWMVFFVHLRARGSHGGVLPGYRLPMEAVTVALVTLTGHLGGFLSGVNGPG